MTDIDEDDIIEYIPDWKPATLDYVLDTMRDLSEALPDWDIGFEYREFNGRVIPCFVAHWPFANIDFGDLRELFTKLHGRDFEIIDVYIHPISNQYLHAEFVAVPRKWYLQLKKRGVVTCSMREKDC